jgi:hypothetical protein
MPGWVTGLLMLGLCVGITVALAWHTNRYR